MVKGATFWRLGRVRCDEVIWVGDLNWLAVVRNLVAIAGNGINVFQTI